jgi:hypothetical protein
VLGVDGRRPTLKWNGYGEFVAHLYDGLEKSAFRLTSWTMAGAPAEARRRLFKK